MNKPAASFLSAKNARDALTPLMSVSSPVGAVACRTKATTCVSAANQHEGAPLQAAETDSALTPDELEQAISEIGQRFVEAAERAVKSNCFGDMGEASRLWSIQKHLIGLRRPETVDRMERERGLK